ncbi:hypothetical protein EH223_06285 [candidate division KSB1 bacterium]|nr:hypothetical protein [candidate division KSB1 bacterium]RQW05048.1 MAG: hypothetical protein EH223_06285 [candidate division KSB1 bacterium]
MFSYDVRGIKIDSADFWLDARRKVAFSFVSHGHSDHLKNHDIILATPPTIQFHAWRARQKKAIPLNLREQHEINDAIIELFSAGHILGSAMCRVTVNDISLLYTGDFKMKKSWTAEDIDIPHADILIMESTFGSPEYVYDHSPDFLQEELAGFVEECFRTGITPVVMGYALGKAQEAMKMLGDAGYNVRVHRAAWELAKIYMQFGIEFANCTPWKDEPVAADEILLIPPHSLYFKKVKNMPLRYRTVFLSGWANGPNGNRFGADYTIPISDHADFNELLDFVHQVNPHKVYTTHGFEHFPHHLRALGYDAELLTA